jgi:hypothetical protein
LETVSYECGGPAEEDPAHALSFVDQFPGLSIGFIEVGVDLSSGLDDIEGGNRRVGWAAGWEVLVGSVSQGRNKRGRTNDSSERTCCEVLPAVELNLGLWEGLLEGRHLYGRSTSLFCLCFVCSSYRNLDQASIESIWATTIPHTFNWERQRTERIVREGERKIYSGRLRLY